MAAEDKYSLTTVALYHNVAVANTFFINVIDDTLVGDEIDALAGIFDTEILALIAANQVSELEYECLLIQKLSPQTEPAVVVDSNRSGALSLDGLPSNLSMCMNHVSADGKPRFRGRWFIPGIRENQVTNGRFTDAINGNFILFRLAVVDTYGPAGQIYQLNHFSRVESSFTTITRAFASPIPRKLRNRTRKLCSIS